MVRAEPNDAVWYILAVSTSVTLIKNRRIIPLWFSRGGGEQERYTLLESIRVTTRSWGGLAGA